MLEFAEAFTIDSSSLTAGNLQALREVGFTEKQVLDIVLASGYRHYITRIADATGAELDEDLLQDDEITATYSYVRAAGRHAADVTDAQRAVLEAKPSGSGPRGDGPWRPTVPERELPDEVREVYATWRSEAGFVPALFPALSLHPKALVTAHHFLRGVSFGASGLGGRREGMIAVLICGLARCPSLALLYGEHLRRQAGSLRAVRDAVNWRDAALAEADKAILAFVEQMTLDCSQITQNWLDGLRSHGFEDALILDMIVETAALNCFLRIANALGVPQDEALRRDAGLVAAVGAPG
ncbi:MAG: hypothetical protein HYY96_00695 [Candidatus Tectomicrobia bacterium]|nr:hypothetical protein [Candidatus Tectomicrobia bacterium]